jgi:MYXO-CTERM domain-containing protein
MKTRVSILTLVALATLPAATINSVYNTGTNNTGAVLPLGSTDPHWFTGLVGSGAALKVSNPPNAGWMANTPVSEWIDNTGNRVLPAQEYIYMQFDLTGLDPATVDLKFRMAVDNDMISYDINGGTSIQSLLPSGVSSNFTQWHTFEITSSTPGVSFTTGSNDIRFDVRNAAGTQGGFRLEWLSATADQTPEPGTMEVLGLGLAGLGLARWRRRISI